MSGSSQNKANQEKELNQMYFKICTMLMMKFKKRDVIISLEEMQEMDQSQVITVTEVSTGLRLQLMDGRLAEALHDFQAKPGDQH